MVQKRSYRKIIKQNKKGGFSGVYVGIEKLKFLFDNELHLQLFPGLNRVYCPDRK